MQLLLLLMQVLLSDFKFYIGFYYLEILKISLRRKLLVEYL